jgi:hypothetical protein
MVPARTFLLRGANSINWRGISRSAISGRFALPNHCHLALLKWDTSQGQINAFADIARRPLVYDGPPGF